MNQLPEKFKDPSKWQLRDGSEVVAIYPNAEDTLFVTYKDAKNYYDACWLNSNGMLYDNGTHSSVDLVPKPETVERWVYLRVYDRDTSYTVNRLSREAAESLRLEDIKNGYQVSEIQKFTFTFGGEG